MEDEDNEGPTLGNQAGIHRGMVKEHSDHDDQQLSQPGHPMEYGNLSTRTYQPTSCDGKRNILPDGRRANGPVSHGARVRAVFEELGDEEQKELLVDLVQDFA